LSQKKVTFHPLESIANHGILALDTDESVGANSVSFGCFWSGLMLIFKK